jgi:hypothetical protein
MRKVARSRLGERQPREHHKVGVKPDACETHGPDVTSP